LKLQTRLIIAFLVMILVPLLLGIIAFRALETYQAKAVQKAYGITGITYHDLTNSMELLSTINGSVSESIVDAVQSDSDTTAGSETYLEAANEELTDKYSCILVKEGGNLVYNGWEGPSEITAEMLPLYGTGVSSGTTGFYIGGDIQCMARQADFTLSDGTEGSLFVITHSQQLIPQMQDMTRDTVVMVIFILCITAVLLSWWLNQYIIHPIAKLTTAAKNIKEGNLDFTMQGMASKDEIGELCMNFEEMRKRLKDQAEEKVISDKESKELISNISHDLKTPITAVKGYVEGIMDGVADTPEKMDRYIRTIYNKANEMDGLINELTFYSKIDTNRIPYTFSILNAVHYFDDCADELKLELESKNVKLEYENTVGTRVRIIADAEQLRRVINNIVSNSIKYMDKEYGIIQLRVRDVGDFIQVEMEDNGKGIAAKDLPFIFERFYRTDASRNSSKGGSGIGLSIVKKIVDDHGGKIWAASKEGCGTTMSFVIRKYQEVPVNEKDIDNRR